MAGPQAVFAILGVLIQEKEEVKQPQDEHLIRGFWTHKHGPAFWPSEVPFLGILMFSGMIAFHLI